MIAGNVFESNTDLNGLKMAQASLTKQDAELTKEVESLRKESLIGELKNYKSTCEELVAYFTEKDSKSNLELSETCVSAADKLLQPEYTVNGADFIETLSRERVFTAMQKASMAKQQLIQDEQYALAVKKKEEERLTIVPPAPRQEGKIIVVNLGLQRLYAYENGSTLFPTAVPITTRKQGFETVTGEFAVYLKELQHKMVSPFPGIYYDDVVNYWMPFYLGYGLHDAPWRSIYGTQDYKVVGSHGCVNIPFKETSILYNWAVVGTRVIVL
ncbi:MAG: L,D-transpeptidase [Candidatus Roizmanbacteria bacterium]|nr:L,D-transpeptidase [Candidatus Roizmanbacteria bacterium]